MKKNIFFFFLLISVSSTAQTKIIAYATGRAENIVQYPVDKLTHIIYSFLKIQNDTLTFRDSIQENTVQQLVALKAANPQLKIMVSVGGWGGCSFCSELFAGEEQRSNFAKTTVALLKQYGIDGLDLDWEYPAIEGYPGHKYDTADKDHFTELVKALRQEMGSNYLLSFAAGSFMQYLQQSVNWDAVMPQVDFVNLMSYDLVGGFATVTGHHTLLQDYMPGQESAAKTVNWLLDKKVPAGKVILGAAMYARVWDSVPDIDHGLYQPGRFKQGVAFADFKNYFSDTSGYQYYRDKKGKAPYQYNASKNLFASFDDEWSITEKTKFIRRKKLGGIMFWELALDAKTDGLIDAMYNGLR